MNPNQRMRYHATSKDMVSETIPNSDFVVEYNPNIEMYRLNRKGGVPFQLGGYTPHREALLERLKRYER